LAFVAGCKKARGGEKAQIKLSKILKKFEARSRVDRVKKGDHVKERSMVTANGAHFR